MHTQKLFIVFLSTSNLIAWVCCTGYETFNQAKSGATGWCYHQQTCDQSTWKYNCSSKYQSPINLPNNLTLLSNQSYQMVFPKSNLSLSNCYVRWMGVTVSCDLTDMGEVIAPTFHWNYTGYTYKFHGLHLHYGSKRDYGSEHTLDGKPFPAEVHLVYYRNLYASALEAVESGAQSAITVFAFFIDTVDNGSVETGIFEKIGRVLDAGVDERESNSISTRSRDSTMALGELFVGNQGGFAYTYVGSMTTPPCHRTKWIVLRRPVVVHDWVIEKFRRFSRPWSLLEGENTPSNFRSLQTAKNRYVELIKMSYS